MCMRARVCLCLGRVHCLLLLVLCRAAFTPHNRTLEVRHMVCVFVFASTCVCVRACVRACVSTCVRACVRACRRATMRMCVRVCVRADIHYCDCSLLDSVCPCMCMSASVRAGMRDLIAFIILLQIRTTTSM